MMSDQLRFQRRTGMSLVSMIVLGVFSFLPSFAVAAEASAAAGASPGDAKNAQVVTAYGQLPLSFIENKGQVDQQVKFYEKGSGHATYFAKDGIYLSLVGASRETPNTPCLEHSSLPPSHIPPFKKGGKGGFASCTADPSDSKAPTSSPQPALVKLIPLGANKNPKIVAEGVQEGKVNYFIGNDPKQWKTNVPTYQAVVYQEIYPGIDMKFYGNNRQLEYDIIVKPGADPSKVTLAYEGIEGLRVTEDGDLEIGLNDAKVLQKKPVVYQMVEDKRVAMAGTFRIHTSPNHPHNSFAYGFEVASYNGEYPLIIDPILEYSTYLGGNGFDKGWGIAVGPSGNAYVAGSTNSTTLGPALSGPTDVFVAKLNTTGTGLDYFTFLGGSGEDGEISGFGFDFSVDIAVDALDNAYVTGATASSAHDFPTLGAFQPQYKGGLSDIFVTKLNGSGTVVYSTYLGGIAADRTGGIAVDASGMAYVTGVTSSAAFPNPSDVFPTTSGAYNTTPNVSGGADIFVAKLDPSLSGPMSLVYSTFLGGSASDFGVGIAVDTSGMAYVTGVTDSGDFPTTLGPSLSGPQDTFMAKFNPAGNGLSDLLYSRLLGGSGTDTSSDIAVDTSFRAYVTGVTDSGDLFTNVGPSSISGPFDAFVTRLKADGTIDYSRYLGGSLPDGGSGIAVDTSNRAYVTGATRSTDFPVTLDAISPSHSGDRDAFIVQLDLGGNILFGTFLGGSNFDRGQAIAVEALGNATYVVGQTISSDFPTRPIIGAYDPLCGDDGLCDGGVLDAFVAKISFLNPCGGAGNTPCGTNVSVSPGSGTTMTFPTVTSPGNTTVTTNSTGPPIPAGFELLGTYYDITTTAGFTPPITVCIQYGPPGDASARLFHFESGAWVDKTTSNNTTTGIICGQVSSLSPFFVGSPVPGGPKPTAIRLSSFTVTPGDRQVIITWTTGAEIDNEGFRILRSASPHGPFEPITRGLIPARGGSPGGASYSVVDAAVEPGRTYYYQLEDVDMHGLRTAHTVAAGAPRPASTRLPEGPRATVPPSTAASISPPSAGSSVTSFVVLPRAPEPDEAPLDRPATATPDAMASIPAVPQAVAPTGTEPARPTAAPLTLVVFAHDGQITLEWTVVKPTDRFNVLRSETEDGAYRAINPEEMSAQSAEGGRLSFLDPTAEEGRTYFYQVERLSKDGASTRIGPIPATRHRVVGRVSGEVKTEHENRSAEMIGD